MASVAASLLSAPTVRKPAERPVFLVNWAPAQRLLAFGLSEKVEDPSLPMP
jgi:hypothetical protein